MMIMMTIMVVMVDDDDDNADDDNDDDSDDEEDEDEDEDEDGDEDEDEDEDDADDVRRAGRQHRINLLTATMGDFRRALGLGCYSSLAGLVRRGGVTALNSGAWMVALRARYPGAVV